jgi:gluconate 2-dehydrogenase alpha chain
MNVSPPRLQLPQNAGFNLTGTAGALAYRAAEGIPKYHKSGGSLV